MFPVKRPIRERQTERERENIHIYTCSLADS